jgi:hypothetical protein
MRIAPGIIFAVSFDLPWMKVTGRDLNFCEGASVRSVEVWFYLSWVLTLVKVDVNFVPIVVAAPMMTTLINAAMSPYSIAVAPLSSRRKLPIGGLRQVDSILVIAKWPF